MEGTLYKKNHELDNGKVAPSAWTTLAKELGDDCYREEELTKDKWLNDEYDGYLDWMLDTVTIHKKYGLTQKTLNKIVDNAELHDGAEELFEFLRSKNIVTVLVSGGFKALADKAQRQLRINHAFSACEYFFDERGHLEFFNLLPSDNEGKASFMMQIASEHGVSPQDCLFVGDGKNDIYLAQSVGTSIAFNAQAELDEISTIKIKQKVGQENLKSIILYLL